MCHDNIHCKYMATEVAKRLYPAVLVATPIEIGEHSRSALAHKLSLLHCSAMLVESGSAWCRGAAFTLLVGTQVCLSITWRLGLEHSRSGRKSSPSMSMMSASHWPGR